MLGWHPRKLRRSGRTSVVAARNKRRAKLDPLLNLNETATEEEIISTYISYVVAEEPDAQHDEIANLLWEFAKFEECVAHNCKTPVVDYDWDGELSFGVEKPKKSQKRLGNCKYSPIFMCKKHLNMIKEKKLMKCTSCGYWSEGKVLFTVGPYDIRTCVRCDDVGGLRSPTCFTFFWEDSFCRCTQYD